MAKRTRPFQIQLAPERKPHSVPPDRWHSYLRLGLIVVSDNSSRLARLRDCLVKALFVEGELRLVDVGASLRTNAEVIDHLWPLANAGQQILTDGERRAVAAIRRAFGEPDAQPRKRDKPMTRAAVAEYLADQRQRRIQDELVRLHSKATVIGRGLLGARGELLDQLEAAA